MPHENIRPAGPLDAAALAAIESASFDHPWSLTQITDQLAAPTGLTLLCPGGCILGSIVCDEAEILRVAVEPAFRGQGLGRALVAAFLAAAADAGAATCFLEVAAGNVPARALYRSAGFSEAGLRKKYYTDGDDAILMNRALRLPAERTPS